MTLFQENLLIVIRFRNNKTLEFDADTAEEKYTICRLLGIILGNEQIENHRKFIVNLLVSYYLENCSIISSDVFVNYQCVVVGYMYMY